jgi:P-type Ca2+ transporter type 2C
MASSDIGDPNAELRNLISVKPGDYEVPNNPFAFTTELLSKLVDPKNLDILRAIGGSFGLVFGLRTDIGDGLSPDEDTLEGKVTLQDIWHTLETRKKAEVSAAISKSYSEENFREINVVLDAGERPVRKDSTSMKRKSSSSSRRSTLASVKIVGNRRLKRFSDRIRIFDENRIPSRKPKGIFQLMWMALQDKILVRVLSASNSRLIMLSIAAVVSLALGFYQSFRPGATNKVEWVEGVAILVAIAIVTVVQSVNDYQKERQFMKLNQKVRALLLQLTCRKKIDT